MPAPFDPAASSLAPAGALDGVPFAEGAPGSAEEAALEAARPYKTPPPPWGWTSAPPRGGPLAFVRRWWPVAVGAVAIAILSFVITQAAIEPDVEPVRSSAPLDATPARDAAVDTNDAMAAVPPPALDAMAAVPPAVSDGMVGVPPAVSDGMVGVPPAVSDGMVAVPPAVQDAGVSFDAAP